MQDTSAKRRMRAAGGPIQVALPFDPRACGQTAVPGHLQQPGASQGHTSQHRTLTTTQQAIKTSDDSRLPAPHLIEDLEPIYSTTPNVA